MPRPTARSAAALPLLARGQVLHSPETGALYEVERLLGAGGFGQVYLSRRLGRSREIPESLCIKVSGIMDGWLREAYFGLLLEDHPRAIRVYDRFALARPHERPLYCLALEFARHGDLSA